MSVKTVSSVIPIELYRRLVNKTIDENITIRKAINEALETYVKGVKD